jgi:uncharacterized metal-binding protein YceD (DUF177 family)
MTTGEPTPEFSRPVRSERIPTEGQTETLTATPEECAALAERFELQAINALEAEIQLKLIAGGPMVRLTGWFRADVVQTCVATLEPLPVRVEERFEMLFGPEAEYRPGQEIHLDAEAADPPEPFGPDGIIDVGEAVAEHLLLALDPFPRKAEAAVEVPKGVEKNGPDALPNTPFAALQGLKDKLR